MTDFIRNEGLLPAREVNRIWSTAPTDLVRFQDVAASIPLDERPTMRDWIDRFNVGVMALGRQLLDA
jgi:hypothetical protein